MKTRLFTLLFILFLSLGLVTAALTVVHLGASAMESSPPAGLPATGRPAALLPDQELYARDTGDTISRPQAPDSGFDWDYRSINFPRVIKDGLGYRMWYDGSSDWDSATGMADSVEGITWTKSAANPILGTGAGGVKGAGIDQCAVRNDS